MKALLLALVVFALASCNSSVATLAPAPGGEVVPGEGAEPGGPNLNLYAGLVPSVGVRLGNLFVGIGYVDPNIAALLGASQAAAVTADANTPIK